MRMRHHCGTGRPLPPGTMPKILRGNTTAPQCTWWCWVLPDAAPASSSSPTPTGLNAPDGAGCSLTPHHVHAARARARRLNAPDGAGRSLTSRPRCSRIRLACLNAPGGAGCSLTGAIGAGEIPQRWEVSMHLMVLDAPWLEWWCDYGDLGYDQSQCT